MSQVCKITEPLCNITLQQEKIGHQRRCRVTMIILWRRKQQNCFWKTS